MMKLVVQDEDVCPIEPSELHGKNWLVSIVLPLAFRDDYMVFRDTVSGPVSRPIAGSGDRYWDVLTWRLADGS